MRKLYKIISVILIVMCLSTNVIYGYHFTSSDDNFLKTYKDPKDATKEMWGRFKDIMKAGAIEPKNNVINYNYGRRI